MAIFHNESATNLTVGLAAVGANLYGANKQYQATKETNAANLALAREQNAFNERMWNLTNEYNTTANQLQRWKDAGLNPTTFAGQASPVEARPIESANLANQQVPDVGSFYSAIGSSLLQARQMAQEYDLRKSQIQVEQDKVDIEKGRLGLETKQVDTFIKKADAEIDKLKADQKVSEEQASFLKQQTAVAQKQIDLMNEQVIEAKNNNRLFGRTEEALVHQAFNQVRLQNAEFDKMVAEKDFTYAEYDRAMEELHQLINYGAPLKRQTIELGGYQIEAYKLQNGRIEFELNFDKANRDVDKWFNRGSILINGLATGASVYYGAKGANGLSRINRPSKVSNRRSSYGAYSEHPLNPAPSYGMPSFY